MAGLGDTVARLLRQQTLWRSNFSVPPDDTVLPPVRGKGLLEEVKDNGPNPGNLGMFRYVPPKVQQKAALVVVLHGCTQSAVGYADGAGWVELADRYGFCLLMPEQRRANNPNLCFNWFMLGDTTRGSGEAQSIHDMIAQTIADCGIDPTRVFITGLSAGGAMTSAMLATYPEVFSAGAIIAGLPYQSASDIPGAFQAMADARVMPAAGWANLVRSASHHKGPWPRVSIWHGTADHTVHPLNSEEIVKQWTQLHEIGQKPEIVENKEAYTRRVWTDESGEQLVEEYLVSGLGHGTPLATGHGQEHFGKTAPFLLEAGLSSSHRIAKFWGIAEPRPPRVSEDSAGEACELQRIPGKETQLPQVTHATKREPQADDKTDHASPWPRSRELAEVINRALRSAGLMK